MPLELIRASWPAPHAVRAASTTRRGGTSTGAWAGLNLSLRCGDDPAHVMSNRLRLREALELDRGWHWLHQVHGARAVDAGALEHDRCQADAAFTRRSRTVCAVMTADCVPVLLAARDASVVAAAHAGWRGLAAGIIEATVGNMRHNPDELLVWLGPAISQAAFEVGDEVREVYTAQAADDAEHFVANARGRWQADLYGLARRRLQALGVTAVTGGDFCTFTDRDRFFSYRRNPDCGRMVSFVAMRGLEK